MAPQPTTTTTMESPSPMRPVPPPSKKQRSSGGAPPVFYSADSISTAADDAIARRRAELRRLQQMRTGGVSAVPGGSTTASSTEGLLAMARTQLGSGGPPPVIPSTNATRLAGDGSKPPPTLAPELPSRSRVARVRRSDIFPHGPKLPAEHSKLANGTGNAAHNAAPPPPRVARRLDPTFADGTSPPAPPQDSRAKSAPPMRPPPPPMPPSLVSEAPPERSASKQPSRTHVERPPPTPYYPKKKPEKSIPEPTELKQSPTPPTTPHREMLRNLREYADTPPSSTEEKKEATPAAAVKRPLQQSPELRLAKELKQANDAKAEALQTVARLEGQVQQLRNSPRSSLPSMEKLVQIAETKGETAALQWAREQVVAPTPQHSFSQVGFLSPLNKSSQSPVRTRSLGALSPLVAAQHPSRTRVATPHPKRRSSSEGQAEKERDYLVAATKVVPYEYTSALATYMVRLPYCSSKDSNDSRQGPWDTSGVASKQDYVNAANVGAPSSLEILAQIGADKSVLTVSGVSTVRHSKSSNGEGQWKVYENVDEMDKPLGCVMYIDGDANEKEYWLDAIYEEALATREAYCSSLISTASGLQAAKENGMKSEINGPMSKPRESVQVMKPVVMEKQKMTMERRPQTVDACVGTEDLVFSPPKMDGPPVAAAPKSAEKGAAQTPPPAMEEEDSSSDFLSMMLATLFTTIGWLIWLVLVRIPLKLFSYTLLVAAIGALLSMAWLYLADDNGAQSMGAGIGYGFNPPGVL